MPDRQCRRCCRDTGDLCFLNLLRVSSNSKCSMTGGSINIRSRCMKCYECVFDRAEKLPFLEQFGGLAEGLILIRV